MKTLVIDTSLNSLKFTLFEMNDEIVICSGLCDRIGLESSYYTVQYKDEKITEEVHFDNFFDASKMLLDKLMVLDIVSSFEEIKVIGFRILQGKDFFSKSVFLTDEVVSQLKEIDLDSSSMKNTIDVILAFREILPNTEMVGVFETAFFQTLSEESYLYALPYRWYFDYGVRKYGTDGISHQYAMEVAKDLLKKDNFKLISCVLNENGSICAISNGRCMNISTGFSSLEGIISGTKSGTIDSTIIPYVMEKEGKNVGEVLEDLNCRSGLLGLSEASGNIHDILSLSEENEKALLAKKIYIQKIVDYIAQYYVLLEGVDMITFSGDILENNFVLREEILNKLSCLGVKVDSSLNASLKSRGKITMSDSSIPVYVIPKNLELEIARECFSLMYR